MSNPVTWHEPDEVALAMDSSGRRYRKGIRIGYMQERIVEIMNRYHGTPCLLIDEADNVRPDADALLTFLAKTLPRRVGCRLILIMLTNRLDWEKALDPRILSFLKKSDFIFEPYDALDLYEILKQRVEKALDESKVEGGALRRIAAYASRETGDARKAVELLVKPTKVAEGTTVRLTQKEVEVAAETLEADKTEEFIRALATQQKFSLIACYASLAKGRSKSSTGQVYAVYGRLCQTRQIKPLTQRRVSDMISFLDLYRPINVPVVSRREYGETGQIAASPRMEVVDQPLEGVANSRC